MNNFFPAFSFVLASSCIFLSIIILVIGKKRDALSLLFTGKVLAGTVFYIFYPAYFWFPDIDLFKTFYIIQVIMIAAVYSMMLHFCAELTSFPLRNSLKFLLYVPGLCAATGIVILNGRYPQFEWVNMHWFLVFDKIDLWSILYALFYLIMPLICIFILLNWHTKSGLRKDLMTGRILASGLFISSALAFLFDFILKFYGNKLQPMGGYFFFIHVMGLFYCLLRYRFLTFDISSITNEILSNINECIAVIDSNGRIMHANKKMMQITIVEKGLNFGVIFVNIEIILERITAIKNGEITEFEEKMRINTRNGIMHANTFVSRITDTVGDFSGILIVIKEQAGVKEFIKMYGISEREYQVIDLILKGINRDEVSDLIHLKPRTVESHLRNIYIKMNVKNRIELMRIAKKFDLV